MFKLDLEKAEEPGIKLPNLLDHQKSKRVPEKHLLLLYWLCWSLWLCGTQQTGKFWKRCGIPDHLTCLLRNPFAGQEATVRTGHEHQTGSKLGKEYVKAVYCHPIYLTYNTQILQWKMVIAAKLKDNISRFNKKWLFACMLSCFNHSQLFVILWTVVCQTPQFMGFSR